MNDRVIGIIGGMGPEASAKFYLDFTRELKVSRDQEHFRVIIDSNSKIPDRTKAIVSGGESPVDELVKSAKLLENAGAEVLVMTCITAHNFYDEVAKQVRIEFINAIEELKKNIYIKKGKNVRVGVLSTRGTMQSGVFERYFDSNNVVYPNDDMIDLLMAAIYGNENMVGIKNREKNSKLEDEKNAILIALDDLKSKNVDIVVLGCTELPIVFDYIDNSDIGIDIVDPLRVVIEKLINFG